MIEKSKIQAVAIESNAWRINRFLFVVFEIFGYLN